MTKHNPNRAARMDMDIHKISCDQTFVLFAHSLRDTKEVKVRGTLHVQVDRNSVDI
jgi:hypothetical protein